MKISILTLFPEMFSALNESIIGRAQKSGKIELEIINIRDFAEGKHKKCDDEIFGGGAGMLMMAEPIVKAVESVKTPESVVIYTSPKGQTLCQSVVEDLAEEKHLVIICGHYEGIDQRAIDLCVDREISIGNYVLTGGELPAMVIADSVARYVPGVITAESLLEESFTGENLEYPQYTRPRVFRGLEVPEVLLSGNHAEIKKWRESHSKKI
ncbi:MAG: tRNA (guanosine(37)-N1)-methyltransferase TrmD [Clostridia bacterium]|nr:tRNA (guanosine(37)-N1)-methyltransferase TrmD [Clostridia bacterium]